MSYCMERSVLVPLLYTLASLGDYTSYLNDTKLSKILLHWCAPHGGKRNSLAHRQKGSPSMSYVWSFFCGRRSSHVWPFRMPCEHQMFSTGLLLPYTFPCMLAVNSARAILIWRQISSMLIRPSKIIAIFCFRLNTLNGSCRNLVHILHDTV